MFNLEMEVLGRCNLIPDFNHPIEFIKLDYHILKHIYRSHYLPGHTPLLHVELMIKFQDECEFWLKVYMKILNPSLIKH